MTQAQLSGSSDDLTRKAPQPWPASFSRLLCPEVKASEATISASMEALEAKLTESLQTAKASEAGCQPAWPGRMLGNMHQDAIREVRSMVEDALQRVEACPDMRGLSGDHCH